MMLGQQIRGVHVTRQPLDQPHHRVALFAGVLKRARHARCLPRRQRSRRRLVYLPGLRSLDAGTLAELEAADCVFFDGTFYRNDELSSVRPGAPEALAMGHLPIAGPGGSLPTLAKLVSRRLYIHMNNTNPVLDENSRERAEVEAAGVEIARDGQEFEL